MNNMAKQFVEFVGTQDPSRLIDHESFDTCAVGDFTEEVLLKGRFDSFDVFKEICPPKPILAGEPTVTEVGLLSNVLNDLSNLTYGALLSNIENIGHGRGFNL